MWNWHLLSRCCYAKLLKKYAFTFSAISATRMWPGPRSQLDVFWLAQSNRLSILPSPGNLRPGVAPRFAHQTHWHSLGCQGVRTALLINDIGRNWSNINLKSMPLDGARQMCKDLPTTLRLPPMEMAGSVLSWQMYLPASDSWMSLKVR